MLKRDYALLVCWLLIAPAVVAGNTPDLKRMENTQRYDHSSGLGFNYPTNWQLSEQENFLVLTPPKQTGTQPSEMVLVGAEPMNEVTSLTAPAVINWFDQQMMALLGDAQRRNDPETSRLGVTLQYYSSDGRVHRVQYRKMEGLGVYVAHLGASSEYEKLVDAIFASVGGKLALDTALFGTWSRESVSMTDVSYDADGGSSYAGSNAMFYYSFDPQNRVVYESSSAVYAQGSSQGGTSSVSSIGEQPKDYGTYAANGSRISIIWDDGSTTDWDYSVFQSYDGTPALKLINTETGKHKYYNRAN